MSFNLELQCIVIDDYVINHIVITSFCIKRLYRESAIISVICTAFSQSVADYTFLHWYECKKV